MPKGDGTGPMGQGSMTGRNAGYCAGFERPGYANAVPRFGRRFFNQGRGFRRMHWATGQNYGSVTPVIPQAPTKEQEKGFLEQEQKALQEELDAIKKRIAELKEA